MTDNIVAYFPIQICFTASFCLNNPTISIKATIPGQGMYILRHLNIVQVTCFKSEV